MELAIRLVVIAVCFVLIIKGGDYFLDAAIWFAEITKIPQVLIGATIVSVGTTLPEILVSTISAAQGDFGLALTNSVGSMYCNIAVVLGVSLAAVITVLNLKEFVQKMAIVVVTTLATFFFAMDGKLVLWEVLVLLALFVVYMVLNVLEARKVLKEGKFGKEVLERQQEARKKNKVFMILSFVLGAAAIGLGAKFLVDNIEVVAVKFLGISTSVLGVSVVALGTSLPELVTAIKSIKKKSTAISFGNVMGANIINGTFLAGLCGAIGVAKDGACDIISGDILYQITNSVWNSTVMLGCICLLASVAILLVPLFLRKGKTARWQGYALMGIYLLYMVYLILMVCRVFG